MQILRHIRRFQESGLIRRWSQRLVTRTKQHYQTLAESDPGQDQDHHDSDEEDEEEENEEEAAAAASNNKQRKQRVLNMRDLQVRPILTFHFKFCGCLRLRFI